MSRRFFAVSLLVALLVAGGVSFYASSSPDGLERVAETVGFLDTAEDSAAAESPLADYQTRGVDDSRLSGGAAGVVGAVVTLLVMTATIHLVRRRSRSGSES